MRKWVTPAIFALWFVTAALSPAIAEAGALTISAQRAPAVIAPVASFFLISVCIAIIIILLILVGVLLVTRRRQQRTIDTELRRFSTMLGSSFESMAELDLDAHTWAEFHILNGVMEKACMPESLEAYQQRYIREHVYRDDMELFARHTSLEALKSICETQRGDSFNCRLIAPNGNLFWCSILLQGMRATRTLPPAVMLYVRDIDESKQASMLANERMAEALRNAERLSRIKSDFLSRISHEIRTPLNAIMGFLTIARQSIDDADKLTYSIAKADEASRHMLALINDVLDISAIEKNGMNVTNKPFHLREFINNLGSVVFEQARQKGLDFAVRLDGVTEEYLAGDQLRLNQVLMHLIGNAIKFTAKGGKVSLTVRQTALKEDSAYLSFAIADSGIGLREGYENRIFNPFEQEETVNSRMFGGTGLGLPLVKNMVETMGGSISVQSKLGEGSIFTVSLPFGINRYAVGDAQKRRAYDSLNVLLVDDHQTTLEYVTLLLKKLGISHSAAISGDVALQKAKNAKEAGKPFDLYFIDWVMPGMSGRETIEQLLQTVDAQAKIVVITGYDQSVIKQEAVGLPIASFEMKPLFQSTLVDLLGELVGKQSIAPDTSRCVPINLKGNRALLAEDNELNREIATEQLTRLGIAVDAAENGQEAFERFIGSEPGYYQLVLMDIQMPVMDGFDATKAIRASVHPDATSIPIIAMTANAFPEDISHSLAAGMNEHLSKPIDLEALESTLCKFLTKRQASCKEG